MKPNTILPNSFTDKIADPAERRRLTGTPLTSIERQEDRDTKLEREIHETIEQDLNRRGVPYVHSRMDKKPTIREGWPDFTLSILGRPIAIECKLPGQDLSAVQREVMLEMVSHGWNYHVARSQAGALDLIKRYSALEPAKSSIFAASWAVSPLRACPDTPKSS